jgi:hypothetical protein
VAQRGATVILEVQPSLVSLLGSLDGVTRIIAKGDPLPGFDFHCPLMSLPHAFNTAPDTGIVWNGNPHHANDSNRSIALSEFARLFSAQCEFVVLQKELKVLDRVVLGRKDNIQRVSVRIADFADTAALCELMD